MFLSTKQAISRLTSPLLHSPSSILALQPVEYDMPGMVFTSGQIKPIAIFWFMLESIFFSYELIRGRYAPNGSKRGAHSAQNSSCQVGWKKGVSEALSETLNLIH